jgi:protein TonB
MTAMTLDGRVFEPPPLRPPWLRPLVVLIVVALHAAALSIVYLEPPKPLEPPGEVIVDIQPEAPAAEAPPAPPAEAPKPPEQSTSEPPPLPQAVAPPPPAVTPPPVAEQPPPPVEQPPLPPPEPPPPVAEQPPSEAQPPLPPAPVELTPPKPPPPPRRIEPRPKQEPVRPRSETAERKHLAEPARRTASLETGRSEAPPSRPAPASAASLSAYIGEVSATIRSRLFYPPAARARGARGLVGVSFAIGSSGAVSSFAITRSSGDHDLDAAARSLVQGSRFPPPPGGSAHIATSFNYVPR